MDQLQLTLITLGDRASQTLDGLGHLGGVRRIIDAVTARALLFGGRQMSVRPFPIANDSLGQFERLALFGALARSTPTP